MATVNPKALWLFSVFVLLFVPVTLVVAWSNNQCFNFNPGDSNNCDHVISGVTENLISSYPPGLPEASTQASSGIQVLDVRIRAWDYLNCTERGTIQDTCSTPPGQLAYCGTTNIPYTYFASIPSGTDYFTSRHRWQDYEFGPANFYSAIEQAYASKSYWIGDPVQATCQITRAANEP